MEGSKMLMVRLAATLAGVWIIAVAGDASSAHPRANFKGTVYQKPNTEYEALASAPGSEVEYVDGPLAPLYEFLIQHRLQRFCKLLRDAGLEQVIQNLGGGKLEELQRNPQQLRDFLLYHFVVGDFPSNQIQDELIVNSAQGSPLKFNIYGQTYTVSGAEILQPDLEFELGRVYIVDRPLYPIPSEDIATYLQRNHREMYRLLFDAGLIDYLSSGTFTLLVPDEQAFGYLSVELKDALQTNISLAERILFNHILPGSVYIAGIRDGIQLQTVGGEPLTFTIKRGLTFANGIPIILPDVPLTNGVVHVVNRLLLPEGIDADCQCKPSSDTNQATGQVPGSLRPGAGQTQRPPIGPGAPRIPGQDTSRQTPRPVGNQGRPQGPQPSPGLPVRPWSPSRTGQPARPNLPANRVTQSPHAGQPTEALSDDEINNVVGPGVQPVPGQKKTEPSRSTRYPPTPPSRQRITPQPIPQRGSSHSTRIPQGSSYPESVNENYPEEQVTPIVPGSARQTDQWSNRQRLSTPGLPNPQRGSNLVPTTRRPYTTRTYDWNQPRVTQPPLEQPDQEEVIDSASLGQDQGYQTQRPGIQTTNWQQRNQVSQVTRQPPQRTTFQPIKQPQPPKRTTTVRPPIGRPTYQPRPPSNRHPLEPSRQQPSCRRQGERVTPFTQNLPLCSETAPSDCQNSPYDPADSRPLCPESPSQSCRNPTEPYDISDNRPLCPSPTVNDCRQPGQPTYNGDRRPLCTPSTTTQTGCKDPSAINNPSDRRPVCAQNAVPPATQTGETPQGCRQPGQPTYNGDRRPLCTPSTTIQTGCKDPSAINNPSDRRPVCAQNEVPPATQTGETPQGCRQPGQPTYNGDRRPLCTPSTTTQTGCKDPSAINNPSDRRPVCTQNAVPPATQTGETPQGCRRSDEVANPQDLRPLCPEEPPQDCRSFLERPQPGDRRPVCKNNRQPNQPKPSKDLDKKQNKPEKPLEKPSYTQTTQTTRRQSWQSTRSPQSWQSTTRAPQSWQSTTRTSQSWQSTTRAPQSWQQPTTRASQSWQQPTTRAPQSWQQPTTRAPQSWQQPTTRAPQSWQTTKAPQSWQSTSRITQSWQSTTRTPQSWQTSRQPIGKQPQPQTGLDPSQPQPGTDPLNPSQPQRGYDIQPQPQSGTHTSQPQSGTHTSQPQSGTHTSQPQSGTHTSQPQSGTHTTQPQSGRYPSQQQPGIHGSQPNNPSPPGSPQSGSYPSRISPPSGPQTSQPQSGNYPVQGGPASGSYPSQPQSGSYPSIQPGSPQSGTDPSQTQQPPQSGHPSRQQPGSSRPFQPPHGQSQPGRPTQGYPQRGPGSRFTTASPQQGASLPGSVAGRPSQQGHQTGPFVTASPRRPIASTTRVPISVTGTSTTPSEDSRRTLYEIVEDPALLIKGRPVKLTRIFELFHKAGIEDILTGPGPTTVFLPSDDAFALLPQGVVEQLEENPELLRQVLLYHVTTTEVLPSAQTESFLVPSVEGNQLVITMLNGGRLIFISGAKAVAVTRANNGIFYVINQLLYPLPHHDIVGAIQSRPDLTTLAFLLPLSGLEDMLRGQTPFTFLAPTDNAFAQLPQSTYEELVNNVTALQEILLNHIIDGAHYGREFFNGGTFPSARGGKLKFQVVSYGYQVNDVNVKTPEIVTGTGVIHLIDQVLLEDSDLQFFTAKDNLALGVLDNTATNSPQPHGGSQQPGIGQQTPFNPRPVTSQRFPGNQPQIGGLQPSVGQPSPAGQIPGHGQRTPGHQQTSPGNAFGNQRQPGVGTIGQAGSAQQNPGNQPTSPGNAFGNQRQPSVGTIGQPGTAQQNPGQPIGSTSFGGRQPSTHGVRQPIQGHGQHRNQPTPQQGHGQPIPGQPSIGGQQNSGQPSFGGQQNPSQPSFGGQQNPSQPSFGGQQNPGQPSFGGQQNQGQPSFGGQRAPTHGQRTQPGSFDSQRTPSTSTSGSQGQGPFQSGGQPNDVADLARSMGLNKFANWITNTGLLEKIHDGGVYTVFAPTDEAVDSLPQDMVYSMESNPEQVKPILQYHIVPQRLNLNSVTNEETASTLLQGKTIRFNVYSSSQPDCKQLVTASGTPVGEALATMGSIQVIPITQVLYQPSGNLQNIVEASPILQRLNEAVKSARLTWILSGTGPMTVFAPSDQAFNSLTDDQRKTLIEDKQAFSDLLKRHVVRGTYFSSGIQDDVDKKSENNKPIKLSLQEGILTVNSVPVTYSDITATNGVLHVIDQFL